MYEEYFTLPPPLSQEEEFTRFTRVNQASDLPSEAQNGPFGLKPKSVGPNSELLTLTGAFPVLRSSIRKVAVPCGPKSLWATNSKPSSTTVLRLSGAGPMI